MSSTEKQSTIPRILSCLLSEDGQTKRWLAHCLDFDLVTSGNDEDQAWKNLKSVVRLHVEQCFTHWPDGLGTKASKENWAIFESLHLQQDMMRTEKITFKLVAKTPEIQPLWMRGAELGILNEGADRLGTTASSISQIH